MKAPKKTTIRTRLSREQRQQDIVNAARKIFESQGYESATIANIAADIGVVEGTVLHYFKTKRALIVKVIEEFYSEITQSLEEGLAGVNGARNKLRYIIFSHMTFLQENAALCTVILNESRGTNPELLQKVHKLNRRYTNVVINTVKEGKEIGEIADFASPVLVRNVVFGSIEHYLWDLVSGSRHDDVDAVADQITQLVYSGIMKRPDEFNSDVNRLISKLNKMMD